MKTLSDQSRQADVAQIVNLLYRRLATCATTERGADWS